MKVKLAVWTESVDKFTIIITIMFCITGTTAEPLLFMLLGLAQHFDVWISPFRRYIFIFISFWMPLMSQIYEHRTRYRTARTVDTLFRFYNHFGFRQVTLYRTSILLHLLQPKPTDSEDSGLPSTIATFELAVRCFNHSASSPLPDSRRG